MSGNRRSKRRSAMALLCLSTVFMIGSFVSAPAASATTYSEEKMWRMINNTRDNYDRSRLKLSQGLSDKARAHSRRMRSAGKIFHTTSLNSTLSAFNWSVAGENVGVGPDLRSLHRAFMRSTGHRANILYRRYERVGVGVAWRDGRAWVTVMFADIS